MQERRGKRRSRRERTSRSKLVTGSVPARKVLDDLVRAKVDGMGRPSTHDDRVDTLPERPQAVGRRNPCEGRVERVIGRRGRYRDDLHSGLEEGGYKEEASEDRHQS